MPNRTSIALVFFVVQGETATGRSMEACPQKAGQHTGCVPKNMGVHGENPYEENRRHKDERWTRKSEQLQMVGYEAGSGVSVSIVVPGVILREIGLL